MPSCGEPRLGEVSTTGRWSRRSSGRTWLRSLPANLLEAVGDLEQDDVLRAALGRGRNEDYVDYYARVKRDEWFRRATSRFGAWEIAEYLTRF